MNIAAYLLLLLLRKQEVTASNFGQDAGGIGQIFVVSFVPPDL